jgi:hypothetical protein
VPGWLRQAVIVLTLPRLMAGPGAVRDRWQRYTSLGIIDHSCEADTATLALGIGSVDAGELRRLAKGRPMGVLIPEMNGRPAWCRRRSSNHRRPRPDPSPPPVARFGFVEPTFPSSEHHFADARHILALSTRLPLGRPG